MTVEAVCPPVGAQCVGLVFVERYYNSFHQCPQDAHKFYLDSSELSRPGPQGEMISFTTRQGIHDAIMSLYGSKNLKVQLYTSDAQFSHKGGIIVLVTGCLTGKDNIKRKFIQTFFLVPQDKAYFVLNDVFRYIDDKESADPDSVIPHGDHQNFTSTSLVSDLEPNHNVDQPLQNKQSHVEAATEIENKISDKLVNKDPIVNIEEATPVAVHPVPEQNGVVSSVTDSPSFNNAQVASPKKSYASMLMKIKSENNTVIAPVHWPPTAIRPEPIRSEQKLSEPPAASEASTLSNNGTPKSTNDHPEAKGFCIVIRNLPLTAKFNDVGLIFNKYGTIRRGSIQVRSYARDKNAFAFVNFENAADMEKAIKASPITMDDGRVITVEAKKPHSRGSNGGGGRDKNQAKGNGGFRKDQVRERGGGGGGGRGNGRSEVKEEENTTGKPRVYIEIDEEGFQTKKKVYANGGGKSGQ